MKTTEIMKRKAQIAEELKAGGITEERVAELEKERIKLDAQLEALEEIAKERGAAGAKAFESGIPVDGIKIDGGNGKNAEKRITATRKYEEAFLNGLKVNDYAEARALLTTNGTNSELSLTGYIPVPDTLAEEIKTAWDEAGIMSLVRKSYFKGNLRVPFELSADGANIHLEGDEAPNEEVVTLGVVELKSSDY